MILLSKLVTALVLPPGCFILGLLFFVLFLRKRRGGGFFPALLGLMLYLLSIEPVEDGFLRSLEDRHPPLPAELPGDIDALVVLGGGVVEGSPEEGGRDSLTAGALKRVVYAAGLRERFSGPYVVAGGKVFDRGQETEAEVMGRLLVSLGVGADRIRPEGESRNTWQNARNVAERFGYKKVLVVTSAYHMPRSVFCFEENGVAVVPAPTDYQTGRRGGYDVLSFLPSMGALSGTWKALHEYVGILSYRMLYP